VKRNSLLVCANFSFSAVFSNVFNDWQKKAYLLLAALALLLAVSLPAGAAVEEFVAGDANGDYKRYSYEELLNSYAKKVLGLGGDLYEDFSTREIVALKIRGHGYFDYKDILDHYAGSLSNGEKFDLLHYAGNGSAKKAELPPGIELITSSSGELPAGGDAGRDGFEETGDSSGEEQDPGEENNPGNEQAGDKEDEPGEKEADPEKEGNEEESDSNEADDEAEDGEKESLKEDTEEEKDTPIKGSAEVSLEDAKKWAAANRAHQRYIDIASIYWEYGEKSKIRPEVLYAQAAYETGFGRFGGQVPLEYNNWAGIKKGGATGDEPEDHEEFATPEDGVRAHFNHMSAYVGLSPLGETHDRYDSALRLSWAGTVQYVEELSGKWAPSSTYHVRIVEMIGEMEE